MRRSTFATESLFLLLKYVFDDLNYRRCEWKCDSLNIPSRNAALRFGFSFEGTFRHAMVVKGRNRDTDWFSMTSEEWPNIKHAFERWLDEENFDEHGQQRNRLKDFMF